MCNFFLDRKKNELTDSEKWIVLERFLSAVYTCTCYRRGHPLYIFLARSQIQSVVQIKRHFSTTKVVAQKKFRDWRAKSTFFKQIDIWVADAQLSVMNGLTLLDDIACWLLIFF